MGQIFNRIKRISQSYLGDDNLSDADRILSSEDDELKKVIEELNRQDKQEYSSGSKDNSSDQKEKMNLSWAFRILNINDASSNEEIRSAYKARIKEYHPDRVSHLGSELIDLAEKKTQEITEAYEIIKDSKGL